MELNVWDRLCIKRASGWLIQGGLAGVRDGLAEEVAPLWTDEQLGLGRAKQDLTVERQKSQAGAILERSLAEVGRGESAAA